MTEEVDFLRAVTAQRPKEPTTRRAYDALLAAASEMFGSGKFVRDDDEMSSLWCVGDVDIAVNPQSAT